MSALKPDRDWEKEWKKWEDKDHALPSIFMIILIVLSLAAIAIMTIWLMMK